MKIACVGLGLIGGSFAKAFALAGHDVYVWNRTRATAERAVAEGVAKGVLDGDFSAMDVIVISLPPSQVVSWIDSHQHTFRPGAVVTDATGVKTVICKALRKYALNCSWNFVGGHPMAGKEVVGWDNASADLYRGASMIFTPWPSMGRGPLDLLEELFRGIGFARVIFTTPEHHDEMIAYTSQLAHVVSNAYVQDPNSSNHVGYSAGSFRDMTRVARVDPVIWAELFIADAAALSAVLGGLIDRLTEFKNALDTSDTAAMIGFLAAGRDAKSVADEAARRR